MISIDGNHLTVGEVVKVAKKFAEVKLNEAGDQQVKNSYQNLVRLHDSNKPVYGINTGFGIFADKRIDKSESAQLSRNLILSHAVGFGDPLPEEVVRAATLIRANTLAKGFSGVRPEIISTLLALLNKHIYPVIPSQGSLGSSGDLSPLSHLALIFTTDDKDRDQDSGYAWYEGQLLTGKSAMERAGIPRIILGPKEGLALNNGATFCAAVAALCVDNAHKLIKLSDLAIALSLEALVGRSNAFDARLHLARGHEGQIDVAEQIRLLISGSTLVDSNSHIQDAYSLRCAPQVTGIARQTLKFVHAVIEKEMNAATDNPLIFSSDEAISGGNFHGEPVGMVMDFLSIAMAEIGAISERRVFRLTDGNLNFGLPPMLVDSEKAAGLNSGLMMPQYTAASLVMENQTLCHPDSVHSLPTSGEQEDHNANSMTAARHTYTILQNLSHILSIEIYTAIRALDLRLRDHPALKPGDITGQVYQYLRERVPYQAGDTWWEPEIDQLRSIIMSEEFETFMDSLV